MVERIQELKDDVGENRLALIFSAFIASVLFIFIFARQQLYPFGEYTLIYVDGDQYASLMRMVNDALVSGESFLYSFRTVLGSGAIATEGYYAMSPFNLLLFLFPHNLVAGIHFIACIKYISAALAFCALLNACHEGRIPEKSVFSACYAFIGYMSFFAWNLSWMDGVIVLPLVALGLLRLVKERRILLYVCSLAFAVISNFYIGFMICIASVMVYLVVLFMGADDTGISERLRSLPLFAMASLTGVTLSCFVLVPAVLGLPADRKEGFVDLFKNMYPTLRPADLLSMLFTARMCAQSANLPVIFSGVLPLLFVVVFFFREDVPRKKKMTAFFVFLFLAFSFWNSMLNRIWHGMSENVWYNYRYSFVFSFFLLLLAFDALSSFERARVSLFRVAAGLFVFCVWLINETQDAFYAEDTTRDAVLLVAGLVVLWRIRISRTARKEMEGQGDLPEKADIRKKQELLLWNDRWTHWLRTVLLFLMCVNVYRNAVTVMWPDVSESERASAFIKETGLAEEALSLIEDDGDFYRVEKNWRIGRADAQLLRYNGISNYTSTENVPLLELLRSMGIAHGWKWGYHTEHTPFATDTLLGMKYILSKKEPLHSAASFTEYAQAERGTVYENKSALPLVMFSGTLPGTAGDADTEGPSGAKGLSSFQALNSAYAAFSGTPEASREQPVFREIKSADTTEAPLYYKSFIVQEEAGQPVYLYLDFPVDRIYVYAGERAEKIAYNEEQFVYCLGTFARGETVQVCLYVPQPVVLVETDEEDAAVLRDIQQNATEETDESPADLLQSEEESTRLLPDPGKGYAYRYFRFRECLLYTEDVLQAEAIARAVQAHTSAVSVQGNRVNAVIAAETDGFAVSTIPYDDGWRITVDGVSVLPVRYLEQFLAVPVEAGEHTIEMRYVPRGFYAGVALTVLGVLALVLSVMKQRFFVANGSSGR